MNGITDNTNINNQPDELLKNDINIHSSGYEFFFKGKNKVCKLRLNDEGETETIGYTSDLLDEVSPSDSEYISDKFDDTSIKNYDSFIQLNQEKTLARIIAINEDDTIIEIFLPNGEIQKKLNNYYVEKLKNKNLHYEGAEFNIAYLPTEDGMNIKIEPVILNRSKKVNQIFSELGLEC